MLSSQDRCVMGFKRNVDLVGCWLENSFAHEKKKKVLRFSSKKKKKILGKQLREVFFFLVLATQSQTRSPP